MRNGDARANLLAGRLPEDRSAAASQVLGARPPQSPRPPRGLQRRGRELWRTLVERFEFDPDELELLLEVCRTLDTLAALEEAVATSGPVGVDGRIHPAVVESRLQRDLLGRLLRQLAVPGDPATTAAVQLGARGNQARWSNPKGAR